MLMYANTCSTVIAVFILLPTFNAHNRLTVAPQFRNLLNSIWDRPPDMASTTVVLPKLQSQRYDKDEDESTTVYNRLYYRHDRNALSSSTSAANISVDSSTNYYRIYEPYTSDGDFQAMTELTTVVYPVYTTIGQRPYRRHGDVRPRPTKLFVRPIIRKSSVVLTPEENRRGNVNNVDIDREIVPLASVHSSRNRKSNKWINAAPSPTVNRLTYLSPKRNSRITGTNYPITMLNTGKNKQQRLPPYQFRKNNLHKIKGDDRLDLMKIGILTLVKIGLIKLKLFGILKILFFVLLKFKLLLILILVKYLLFCKAIDKFYKNTMSIANWVLLPLSLVPLLMLLLLLPLLLLPLLLPLLLFLPVPVARFPATGNGATGEDRTPPHLFKIVDNGGPVMQAMMHLLESKECVERIACQLATKKESKIFYPIVNWCFGKLKDVLKNRRMSTYMEAFIESTKTYNGSYTDVDGQKWCSKKYLCPKVTYDVLEINDETRHDRKMPPVFRIDTNEDTLFTNT